MLAGRTGCFFSDYCGGDERRNGFVSAYCHGGDEGRNEFVSISVKFDGEGRDAFVMFYCYGDEGQK